MPFFSVVIPVFQRLGSLQKTLDSVLSQTIQDFEIIIVDDGSDVTIFKQIETMANGFADSRIVLLRHQVNKNGAAARNTGIDAAKGRFVCFLDSDDTWLPTKLELVQVCIQSLPRQERFLIHHQYCNNKDGVMSDPMPTGAMLKGESVAHYSFVTNNVGGIQSSTICVPTELAKTVKFNENFSGHQDWDFALRVGVLTEDFRFIDNVLTSRSKDSQDSVAESLDWQYSLWFYRQMSRYFQNTSASHYFQRVILKKAKFSCELVPVFFNKLFFRVVLTNPIFSLKNAFLFLSDYFQYQSRVKKVLHRCQKDKVKTVMIWGANNYAKLLMLNFNQQINVINIIDSKVALSHSQLLGVNITAFRTITRNELDNVDAIILATDNHQRSMKRELSKVSPTLLVKVIEF